jgi:hypothetical protein
MYCYFLFVQYICLGISSNVALPDLTDVTMTVSWLRLQRFCYVRIDRDGP